MWQSLFRISDSAISLLLSFMIRFLKLVASTLRLDALNQMSDIFPGTLYFGRKYLGRLYDGFVRYVSCPTCRAIYSYKDSITNTDPKRSRYCTYVEFPNHVQARMREPCGKRLMKAVRTSKGSQYLAPFRTYCYRSLVDSLQNLLNRPSIIEACEEWRSRSVNCDKFVDVYDDQMWNAFQYDSNGSPFLARPLNFMLMLNCDWFQPFQHTQILLVYYI